MQLQSFQKIVYYNDIHIAANNQIYITIRDINDSQCTYIITYIVNLHHELSI